MTPTETIETSATLVKGDQLRAKYGRQLVEDVTRKMYDRLFEEIEGQRGTYRCRVCSKVIAPKHAHRSRQSTNFARASHAGKHGRDGTAISIWGGADGWWLIPGENDIVTEVARRKHVNDDKPLVAELVKRLAPMWPERSRFLARRRAAEQRLVKMLRAHGSRLFGLVEVNPIADANDVRDVTGILANLNAEIDAIKANYTEAVQEAAMMARSLDVRVEDE